MKTLAETLSEVLFEHRKMDLETKDARDVIVRDIIATYAKFEKSKKHGAVMMTQEASMYNPATDKVPQKPKSI